MVNACILIKVVPVRLNRVLEELRKIQGVVKVYPTYGRFDVVCLVEGSKNEDIAEISALINRLEGVRSTETLIEA
ncbi:Lrp/AsnC ligand binding domain-containing protein [Candidatus Bathyarchaeota archaeon]|nr:Lrp/AsnC ligand binding domain-containing protein [Candidatus Bathyarchaeota archaeon]MBS7618655.1 Lrp/AsnC ligand binding domain-containing protein [Candidatus Bathyarchaeota archaeon]